MRGTMKQGDETMDKEIGFGRDTDQKELAWRRLKEAAGKSCEWLGKMTDAIEQIEEAEDAD